MMNNKKPFIKKIKSFLRNFLDDRSRTLDFICLIVFLEVLNDSIYFTKIIFGIILEKKITTFLGNFFEIIILKKNLKIKI